MGEERAHSFDGGGSVLPLGVPMGDDTSRLPVVGSCPRADEPISVSMLMSGEPLLAQLALFVHHVKMKMRRNKHRTIR